ncbi:MAG: TIGR00366 family protein [Rhodospirillales bacterium]
MQAPSPHDETDAHAARFNPIAPLSRGLSWLVGRYLPDPLVFAILLTLLTFGLAVWLTPKGPLDLIQMWGSGFWNLLAFSMQMALVLVTGHALASSDPVHRGMSRIASVARTPAQGAMLVAFASAIACILNWGFGLVVGAMFAREVSRRIPKADYRLLIASAYIGFMTWHGGFSGSVPLVAATKGNPMEKTVGLIPISDTLFTTYNIAITLALIVVLPIICRVMHPAPQNVIAVDPSLLKLEATTRRQLGPDATPAERIEEGPLLSFAVAAFGIAYLILYFQKSGFNININTVISSCSSPA